MQPGRMMWVTNEEGENFEAVVWFDYEPEEKQTYWHPGQLAYCTVYEIMDGNATVTGQFSDDEISRLEQEIVDEVEQEKIDYQSEREYDDYLDSREIDYT